jgi:hypothetical protein
MMSATREKRSFFSCGAGGIDDSRFAPRHVAEHL